MYPAWGGRGGQKLDKGSLLHGYPTDTGPCHEQITGKRASHQQSAGSEGVGLQKAFSALKFPHL